MKAKLGMKLVVLLGCILTAGGVLAQSPDIVAFHGNGNLTWTNSNSSLFYQVQWAASLIGTGVWQSTYSTLSDIQSTNPTVTTPVPMFYRVAGSSNRVFFVTPLPKTGPTISYATRDDGALTNGVAWPNPRFTIQSNTNCVLDNLTGLIWARNANQFGLVNWDTAVTDCNNLNYGGTNDWRLPNVRELQSLIAWQYSSPALSDGTGTNKWTEALGPFTGVQLYDYLAASYWTSTTCAYPTGNAWVVGLVDGRVRDDVKTSGALYVWPVRGGR